MRDKTLTSFHLSTSRKTLKTFHFGYFPFICMKSVHHFIHFQYLAILTSLLFQHPFLYHLNFCLTQLIWTERNKTKHRSHWFNLKIDYLTHTNFITLLFSSRLFCIQTLKIRLCCSTNNRIVAFKKWNQMVNDNNELRSRALSLYFILIYAWRSTLLSHAAYKFSSNLIQGFFVWFIGLKKQKDNNMNNLH